MLWRVCEREETDGDHQWWFEILDEIMGDELFHRRWLYTAITSAINEVVVLL